MDLKKALCLESPKSNLLFLFILIIFKDISKTVMADMLLWNVQEFLSSQNKVFK